MHFAYKSNVIRILTYWIHCCTVGIMATAAAPTLMSVEDKAQIYQRIKEGLKFEDIPGKYLCCTCEKVPITHFLCQNKHPHCKTCIEKVKNCSKCPPSSNLETTQDWQFEQAILGLNVICPNKDFGCKEIIPLKDLLDHENRCLWPKTKLAPIPFVERTETVETRIMKEIDLLLAKINSIQIKGNCVCMCSEISDQLSYLINRTESVESETIKQLQSIKEEFSHGMKELAGRNVSQEATLEANYYMFIENVTAKCKYLLSKISEMKDEQQSAIEEARNKMSSDMEQRLSVVERLFQEKMDALREEREEEMRTLKFQFSLIARSQREIDARLEEICRNANSSVNVNNAEEAVAIAEVVPGSHPFSFISLRSVRQILVGLTETAKTPLPPPSRNQDNFLSDGGARSDVAASTIGDLGSWQQHGDDKCSECKRDLGYNDYRYICLTCSDRCLCWSCNSLCDWTHYMLRTPPSPPPNVNPTALRELRNSKQSQYVWSGEKFDCPQCHLAASYYRYDCLMCDAVHCHSCEGKCCHVRHYMVRMPNGLSKEITISHFQKGFRHN